MKKSKGFTLIELLAIIVILAIIAVITVPLILGIINDAKLNSITDSAYGYKDSIQNYSIYLQTLDSTNPGLKGSYTVDELKTKGLEVKGQEPNQGTVLIDNEGVSGCLKYDEYASYLYNNKVINTVKGSCPTEKLVTSGDGLYVSKLDFGRLVYRGANPNNRIFLKEDGVNNVLYRIVSYEIDGTIKVVRDEKINSRKWDDDTIRQNTDGGYYCITKYGCNVWGNQSDTLYNGEYLGDNFHYSYYASSDINNLVNGESGKVESISTLNKFLNGKDEDSWQGAIFLDKYIDNHIFYAGGVFYTSSYLGGDKGLKLERDEEKLYTWTGKVGLLNITEHAEATTNENCDVFLSYGYNSIYNYKDEGATSLTIHPPVDGWPCKTNNWTFKSQYNQWTFSPMPHTHNYVWYVDTQGRYFGSSAYWANPAVRPAFYLKADIRLSGSGSEGDEYQINE